MNMPMIAVGCVCLIPVLIPLARMVRAVCGSGVACRNRIDFDLRRIVRRRLVCGLARSGAVRRY